MSDPKVKQAGNAGMMDITPDNEIAGRSIQNELIEEEEMEEDCDDAGNYDEDDSSDDYGSTGEKYGWYNGFSDDAIDDAFEGDPEATWNVD